jgi:GAF domain-containing protein
MGSVGSSCGGRSPSARLVDGPDSGTVLRLVTDAGTELLGSTGTGVMLTDPRGGVEVVAASDERSRFVELLQTQVEQGPCLDCIATSTVVTSADLAAEGARWTDFVPPALEAGYRAVTAIPLRLDGRAVGGLNLLYADSTELQQWQLQLAQAIADLAVLGLVQERGDRRADRLAERTLTALNDRVHLGQAIGLVAGTLGVDPAAARTVLTNYADRHRRALHDVARAVTNGVLDPADGARDPA